MNNDADTLTMKLERPHMVHEFEHILPCNGVDFDVMSRMISGEFYYFTTPAGRAMIRLTFRQGWAVYLQANPHDRIGEYDTKEAAVFAILMACGNGERAEDELMELCGMNGGES